MGERLKIVPMLEILNLEPFPSEKEYAEIPWPEYSALTWMDELMEDYELEMTVTEKPQ